MNHRVKIERNREFFASNDGGISNYANGVNLDNGIDYALSPAVKAELQSRGYAEWRGPSGELILINAEVDQ
jgi:hypothetical protein